MLVESKYIKERRRENDDRQYYQSNFGMNNQQKQYNLTNEGFLFVLMD